MNDNEFLMRQRGSSAVTVSGTLASVAVQTFSSHGRSQSDRRSRGEGRTESLSSRRALVAQSCEVPTWGLAQFSDTARRRGTANLDQEPEQNEQAEHQRQSKHHQSAPLCANLFLEWTEVRRHCFEAIRFTLDEQFQYAQ